MPNCQGLGFSTYDAYLASPHWRDVKRRYRESDRPQDCFLCGESQHVQLHHMTYVRLGRERLDDLVSLCARCHTMVHILIRRGDATLTLHNIVSGERASTYRRQVAAMVERAERENSNYRQLSPLDEGELKTLREIVYRRGRSLQAQMHKRRLEVGNAAFRAERKPICQAAKNARRLDRDQRNLADLVAADEYVNTGGTRSFSPDD